MKKIVLSRKKFFIDGKGIMGNYIVKEFGFENACPVCKEEFVLSEECLLMPCEHHFHKDCLIPWLKERNSCPVCRYELPTDDEDFERRKKEKEKEKLNDNSNIDNNNGN